MTQMLWNRWLHRCWKHKQESSVCFPCSCHVTAAGDDKGLVCLLQYQTLFCGFYHRVRRGNVFVGMLDFLCSSDIAVEQLFIGHQWALVGFEPTSGSGFLYRRWGFYPKKSLCHQMGKFTGIIFMPLCDGKGIASVWQHCCIADYFHWWRLTGCIVNTAAETKDAVLLLHCSPSAI